MYKYAQNKIEGKIMELNKCDSFSTKRDFIPFNSYAKILILKSFIWMQKTARPNRRTGYL